MGNLKFLKSLKTPSLVVALVSLLLLQFQNCTSYSDPSLFEGKKSSSASTSLPSDVRLDSPGGILDVPTSDLALSFGGECNVGLNTQHFIEIQMMDSGNVPIAVRVDNMCPEGSASHPDCFKAVQFRCEHGRYYVHLPLTCATAYRGQLQGVYRLTGQLVTLNASGQEIRDNKASFDRFFTIAWDANSCAN